MKHFAKKSLGQNFLHSTKALKSIIKAGNLSKNDTVLEIGPGRGALTEKILESGAKVIAVEKDRNLISLLNEKFADFIKMGKFQLVEGDILEMNAKDLSLQKYKLIANIPYYITGAIVRKFLEEEIQPEIMVLLLQKEVAERIVARDKKESILSIAVKTYSAPRYVGKVDKESFSPSPNVDSAIVAFENISKNFFIENNISEEKFFEIVKAGFAQKRKKLGGNLKQVSDKLNPEILEKIKDKRAEDLSLSDWQILLKIQR
jgi:16S rRNA (adenine1518-N6/adenine1519-N6)-dimethyltransferase